MRCHVITGPDTIAVRAHRADLLAGVGARPESLESFDLDTNAAGLLHALAAPPMFSTARTFDVTGTLTLPVAQRLGELGEVGQDTVIIVSDTAPDAATKRPLAGVAMFTHHALPHGPVAARQRVRDLAAQHGVTLDFDGTDLLTRYAPHHLERVNSAIAAAAIADITSPTVLHLTRFLGSTTTSSAAWDITDALERGHLATALTSAKDCDPFAVVATLSNRNAIAGRILDDGMREPVEVASAFGVPEGAGAAHLGHAQRLGAPGVAATWNLLTAADRALKAAAAPGGVLTALLVSLHRLWHGQETSYPTRGAAQPLISG